MCHVQCQVIFFLLHPTHSTISMFTLHLLLHIHVHTPHVPRQVYPAQPVAPHTHANPSWSEPHNRFFWALAMYCWTRATILGVGNVYTHAALCKPTALDSHHRDTQMPELQRAASARFS